MINKKLGMIIGAVGLLIMILFFVNAFGASISYWDDNPLKLAPGESKIVSLGLQNNVGGENITLKAELINDGGGIATMVDENLNYFVPFGGGMGVPVKIEIPEDAEIGSIHGMVISFVQVSSGEGGMLRIAGGFTSKIPVEVVGEEESELYSPSKPISNLWILIILIVIVVILIIFATAKKKKTKK